jgi:putative transposase
MEVSFKETHCPKDVVRACTWWSIADPSSYRHVEELRQERGVNVDHATLNR